MATCSVITLALNDLWSKNVLKEGKTKIEDIIQFDELNEKYSDVARVKFGVTNEGKFFDVNTQGTSQTGPLNITSPYGDKTTQNQFAVVNREFVDEFQIKYDEANKPKVEAIVPAPVSPGLEVKRTDIKDTINSSNFTDAEKAFLMSELNDCRTIEDFGELMKKLC